MERYTTSRVIVGRSTSNQVIELLFVVRIRDYILTILDEVGLSSYNAAISLSRGLNDSGDHCAEDCCNSTWTFFTHSLNWAGSTLTMVIKSKFNSHWSPWIYHYLNTALSVYIAQVFWHRFFPLQHIHYLPIEYLFKIEIVFTFRDLLVFCFLASLNKTSSISWRCTTQRLIKKSYHWYSCWKTKCSLLCLCSIWYVYDCIVIRF